MRRRPATVALATVIVLAGCSAAGTQPPSGSPASPSTAAPVPVTSVPRDQVVVLDASRVPGLRWSANVVSEQRLRASWFAIEGADPLNAELKAAVTAVTEPYEKSVKADSSGGSYGDPAPAPDPAAGSSPTTSSTPGPASSSAQTDPARQGPPGPLPTLGGPQMDVTTDLVAVAGDVLGVRVSAYASTPPTTTLTYRTVWFDGTAVKSSRDLFADDAAAGSFVDAVRDRIAEVSDQSAAAAVTADQILQAVAFTTRGEAVAELSAGVLPGLGSVAATVPATTVEPLLSPLGVKARQATTSPGTFPAGATVESTPAGAPDCSVLRCVALTYDDGPVPDTSRLLDVLKEKNAKATFFVVGYMMKAHHSVLERTLAEGHEVGGHSMTHGKLTQMSADKLEYEVAQPTSMIQEVSGVAPTVYRPPYGVFNSRVAEVIGAHGMQVVLWDVDTRDWATKNADKTLEAVREKVQPGSIILMHDLHSTSIDATPAIIDALHAEGYTLVTVSQLLAGTRPQPGQIVSYRFGSQASISRTG